MIGSPFFCLTSLLLSWFAPSDSFILKLNCVNSVSLEAVVWHWSVRPGYTWALPLQRGGQVYCHTVKPSIVDRFQAKWFPHRRNASSFIHLYSLRDEVTFCLPLWREGSRNHRAMLTMHCHPTRIFSIIRAYVGLCCANVRAYIFFNAGKHQTLIMYRNKHLPSTLKSI